MSPDMKSIKLIAPAKINIYLKVLGRRSDGYHELVMLNELLELADEIKISLDDEIEEKALIFECDDKSLPCDETNICIRAACLMRAISGRKEGMRIELKKRIPIAGGLGGGSSDACAVMRGLNHLFELDMSQRELSEAGLKLGADVPFFFSGGPAVVEGIGEKVKAVEEFPDMWIILVNPGKRISTKAVYDAFDLELTPCSDRVSLPCFYKGLGEVIKFAHNDLERVTAKMCPEVEEIKGMLLKYGALVSWMSGSGPTVVGLFEDKVARDLAFKRLSGYGLRVIATRNLEGKLSGGVI